MANLSGPFDKPSDMLFKLVLMALAFAATSLLLRDVTVLAAHIPRSTQEGWNAYLAHAAITGTPLYPQDLMVNNYPPLSFYMVGALSRFAGDPILAGRLVSAAAFLAIAGSLIVILREMDASVPAALFASLFFATALLAGGDYVVIDDPQLLGHALQLSGLSLLLAARREIVPAALAMTAGLFVKHTLIALPLASLLWLAWENHREGLHFAVTMLVFSLAGLIATRLLLDVNLMSQLAWPHLWTPKNFADQILAFLAWSGGALVAALLLWPQRDDSAARLALLYAGVAVLTGGIWALGGDSQANIFFDAAIALSLGAGLCLARIGKAANGPVALMGALPLAFLLAQPSPRENFRFSEAFAREAALDIDFLRAHPGPALCEDLTLCFWAGVKEPADMKALSQASGTSQNHAALAHLIETRHFTAIAIKSITPFALGPELKTVLLAHYRAVRADDNGIFLEPR